MNQQPHKSDNKLIKPHKNSGQKQINEKERETTSWNENKQGFFLQKYGLKFIFLKNIRLFYFYFFFIIAHAKKRSLI